MRTLTYRQNKAIRDYRAYSGLFLHLNHPGGEVRIWSGTGSIKDNDIPGNDWIGVGDAVSFSGFRSAERIRIDELSFTLSKVPKEMAVLAADIPVRGEIGTIFFGFIDEDGRVIDNLIEMRTFTADNLNMVDEGDTSILTLNCLSGIADISNPTKITWSKASQDARIAGDRFQEPLEVPQGTLDTGFNQMSIIGESRDLSWVEGSYLGRSTTEVDHLTSASGTKTDHVREPDFYERR